MADRDNRIVDGNKRVMHADNDRPITLVAIATQNNVAGAFSQIVQTVAENTPVNFYVVGPIQPTGVRARFTPTATIDPRTYRETKLEEFLQGTMCVYLVQSADPTTMIYVSGANAGLVTGIDTNLRANATVTGTCGILTYAPVTGRRAANLGHVVNQYVEGNGAEIAFGTGCPVVPRGNATLRMSIADEIANGINAYDSALSQDQVIAALEPKATGFGAGMRKGAYNLGARMNPRTRR